jgi:multidrug resistance protein, MATE family
MKAENSYAGILKLAGPIAIANLSQMILGIIDTAMVGALNSTLLASAALVNSLIAIPYILGIGLAIGLSPLLTASVGAENKQLFKQYFQNGLFVNALFSLSLALMVSIFAPLIYKIGQETSVASAGEIYLHLMGWSMIPMLLFLTIKQGSDAISMTKIPMILSIIVIPLNILLNYVFIYGNFGMPALGLNGAGVATLICRSILVIAMLYTITYSPSYFSHFKHWYKNWRLHRHLQIKILKIGIPTSLQYAMESWAFAFSGIMMGWLGSKALAAHQIALNMASFTFMGAVGIATAGSIRVGIAYGKNQPSDIKTAAKNTFLLSSLYGLITAILLIIGRHHIPFLFNSEKEVVTLASSLLVLAAIFQISDSTQTTGVSLCRGIQDIVIPTTLVFVAYWIIGIPLGYLLSFTYGMGPSGIWIGFLAGLSASSILLNTRFFKKSLSYMIDKNSS